MAKTTVRRPPAFVARLEAALQRELPRADITTEHVRGRRYRFVVVSDEFSNVGHPERQRRVWDIADAEVARPDLLDVGMILTIAPEELPKA